MKIGSVVKLVDFQHEAADRHGWLWVYEDTTGDPAVHAFRAVADGFLGTTAIPWRLFENWEKEDENR